MKRGEIMLCNLWDEMREKYPNAPDNRLMETTCVEYNRRYNSDVRTADLVEALERRSDQ